MAEAAIDANELITTAEDWDETMDEWFDQLAAEVDISSLSAERASAVPWLEIKCGTLAEIFEGPLEPLPAGDL